jgi:hypothetical protein
LDWQSASARPGTGAVRHPPAEVLVNPLPQRSIFTCRQQPVRGCHSTPHLAEHSSRMTVFDAALCCLHNPEIIVAVVCFLTL